MAQQTQDVQEKLMERLFGQQKAGDVPYILCRRNEAAEDITYELHDYTWEGLIPIIRNGKTAFEPDHNFVLRIGMDGLCMIPDTENNRKRLERISKVTTRKVKNRVYDVNTGEWDETESTETEKPQYERVQDNVVEDQVVDRIVEKVFGNVSEEQLLRIVEAMRKGKSLKAVAPPIAAPTEQAQEPATPPVSAIPPLPAKVKGARVKTGGRPRAQVANVE